MKFCFADSLFLSFAFPNRFFQCKKILEKLVEISQNFPRMLACETGNGRMGAGFLRSE